MHDHLGTKHLVVLKSCREGTHQQHRVFNRDHGDVGAGDEPEACHLEVGLGGVNDVHRIEVNWELSWILKRLKMAFPTTSHANERFLL